MSKNLELNNNKQEKPIIKEWHELGAEELNTKAEVAFNTLFDTVNSGDPGDKNIRDLNIKAQDTTSEFFNQISTELKGDQWEDLRQSLAPYISKLIDVDFTMTDPDPKAMTKHQDAVKKIIKEFKLQKNLPEVKEETQPADLPADKDKQTGKGYEAKKVELGGHKLIQAALNKLGAQIEDVNERIGKAKGNKEEEKKLLGLRRTLTNNRNVLRKTSGLSQSKAEEQARKIMEA